MRNRARTDELSPMGHATRVLALCLALSCARAQPPTPRTLASAKINLKKRHSNNALTTPLRQKTGSNNPAGPAAPMTKANINAEFDKKFLAHPKPDLPQHHNMPPHPSDEGQRFPFES